jgi:hypothetical protein
MLRLLSLRQKPKIAEKNFPKQALEQALSSKSNLICALFEIETHA